MQDRYIQRQRRVPACGASVTRGHSARHKTIQPFTRALQPANTGQTPALSMATRRTSGSAYRNQILIDICRSLFIMLPHFIRCICVVKWLVSRCECRSSWRSSISSSTKLNISSIPLSTISVAHTDSLFQVSNRALTPRQWSDNLIRACCVFMLACTFTCSNIHQWHYTSEKQHVLPISGLSPFIDVIRNMY
jgi:hypothetical protein